MLIISNTLSSGNLKFSESKYTDIALMPSSERGGYESSHFSSSVVL